MFFLPSSFFLWTEEKGRRKSADRASAVPFIEFYGGGLCLAVDFVRLMVVIIELINTDNYVMDSPEA